MSVRAQNVHLTDAASCRLEAVLAAGLARMRLAAVPTEADADAPADQADRAPRRTRMPSAVFERAKAFVEQLAEIDQQAGGLDYDAYRRLLDPWLDDIVRTYGVQRERLEEYVRKQKNLNTTIRWNNYARIEPRSGRDSRASDGGGSGSSSAPPAAAADDNSAPPLPRGLFPDLDEEFSVDKEDDMPGGNWSARKHDELVARNRSSGVLSPRQLVQALRKQKRNR